MDYSYLLIDRFDAVALIRLNRPKVNALSQELLLELRDAVETFDADPAVRCILITGEGDRAFCAGADIPSLQAGLGHVEEPGSMLGEGVLTMNAIEASGTPVVAAVNGLALGGGCELSLACHVRIAADTAQFGLPEVNLGILPGWGGTHRLPRLVGESRALEWMLTGRMVSAEEALQAGLVCRVVAQSELLDAAKEFARALSQKAPLAVEGILRTVQRRAVEPSQGALLEAAAFQRAGNSKDAVEGVSAFLERRAPNYTGE
ncbi:MAG: enoyl-CoA hydratase-related protein [FCB group bacterium]|jgi:enoyl-CoA hydratase/carnithine racemase|nr:enoyl-CoA hydratase-related protein [FCB group bacterium]